MAIKKKTITHSIAKKRKTYERLPVYAYTAEGEFVASYPSRSAFASEHGVSPTAVRSAIRRSGSCAGFRLSEEKVKLFPPIVKKKYPLFPSFTIYKYDRRGTLKGVVTEKDWETLPHYSRYTLVNIFKERKTKKLGEFFYSILKGPEAFTRKSMNSKHGARSKGGVIAISPTGKEHLYPQAAEAAEDLGFFEEHISYVLNGKTKMLRGYHFKYLGK